MIACKYIVSWVSAVTGNRNSTGYPNKTLADKDAKALRNEGAKNVAVYSYK